jgi:hypothetical protein
MQYSKYYFKIKGTIQQNEPVFIFFIFILFWKQLNE